MLMNNLLLIGAGFAATCAAQLFPPPPGCGDSDAFLKCSAANSVVCANPIGLATCYTACEGCCDGEDAENCYV